MSKIKKQSGFTLIEATVYLAVVAVLLVAVVNFHLTLSNTSQKLATRVNVSANRRLALSAVNYLIKNSDGMLKDTLGDCSDFGASPPSLALYFEDDTYLPGTCVENGGGAVIGVDEYQIKLTCYPNMTGNGYHKNCDPNTYPAGNIYYLTSPNVRIENTSLSFSTSTATSTTGFISVLTNLSVGSFSRDQLALAATSTATSTVVLRNEQPDGLVAWWKLDDDPASSAVDSVGGNDATCYGTGYPTPSAGLVDGSSGSFDFSNSEGDYCNAGNSNDLNPDGSFTVTAWIQPDSLGDGEFDIINKGSTDSQKGYNLRLYTSGATVGRLWLRIFDSTTYENVADTSSGIITNVGGTYHVAAVYDLENDTGTMYVYEMGTGGISTTTSSNLPILVNDTVDFDIGSSAGSFDGKIDELRFYNRALTAKEIWALQSQGETEVAQQQQSAWACGDDVDFTYNSSSVTYGSVESSTGECWLDRNLGATQVAASVTDTAAYGDLFQWGRDDDGHQVRTSGTTSVNSSGDTPGHGDFILETVSPYDWRSPQNTDLWQGESGTNNPCPSGWRIPTEAEWEAERLTWSSNNSTGAFASPLKLTVGGFRGHGNGLLSSVGSIGLYWLSDINGTNSRYLNVGSSNVSMGSYYRAAGMAIRCISAENDVATFSCGDVLTDTRDSQTYNTVEIGTQCWMAENLNVGTRINAAVTQTDNASIEKWCYSDTESNCTSDGAFYQWSEMMQYASACNGTGSSQPACSTPVQGICPSGWHLPSHYELNALERAVCTSGTCITDFPFDETTTGDRGTDEGTKLKVGGSSNFEMNLAGFMLNGGSYAQTTNAYLWTSTQKSINNDSWGRHFYSTGATVYRNGLINTYGVNVRCIKDQ